MQDIKEYVKQQKEALKLKISNLGSSPVFYIIQIGNVEASNRYVKNKIKDCDDVGIKTKLFKFPEDITKEYLKEFIKKLNGDTNSIDAVMVQFPLPKHLSESEVMSWINPKKDADGFTDNGITYPATPMGIISFLERSGYNFEDKNALVIGRSNIVGKPAAKLLLDRNCNVAVVHSHTSVANMFAYLNQADLIICATGHENTLTDAYYTAFRNSKPIIFDVGINFDFEGKLIGDCQRNLPYVTYQSPVPGGVGLLTRLQLLENIYKLYELRLAEQKSEVNN